MNPLYKVWILVVVVEAFIKFEFLQFLVRIFIKKD